MLAVFCSWLIVTVQDDPPETAEEEWTGPPSATLHKVTTRPGTQHFEEGVWFHFDFEVDGCREEDCALWVRFYDEKERPLSDRNGEFSDGKGHVVLRHLFRPDFHRARYPREPLFLPLNELHLPVGKHAVGYIVTIVRVDEQRKAQLLLTSERNTLKVDLKTTESGELTKMRPEPGVREKNQRGLRVTTDASIRDSKERKARVAVEIYYGLSTASPLVAVYHHGKSEEGAVRYSLDLSSDGDSHAQKLWVPYDTLPLKVGRNRFFFKLWLQVEAEPDRWITLDSTPAKQFFVDNGSLKLKEVWAIDEKRILFDWDPTPEDREIVRTAFLEFNKRLYDATDGQVRIRKFIVGRMTSHPERCDEPVFRVYHDYKNGDHGTRTESRKRFIEQLRSFAHLGRPDAPGDVHLVYDQMKKKPSHFPAVITHEFFHATFGISDEYLEDKTDPKKSSCQPFCAKDEVLRQAWGTCIMATSNAMLRELCTPETHSDAEGKRARKDCYTVVQERVKKAFRKTIVIPDTPVEGPTDPPEPTFTWDLD